MLSLLALLAACHDSLAPGTKTSGATILSGADVSDTVDAVVTQLLVVEARGNSNLLTGVEVAIAGQYVGGGSPLDPSGFLRVCDAVRTSCDPGNLSPRVVTAGRGQARVRVQFGALAGQGTVIAYFPDFPSSDTAHYTVRPGAPSRVSAFAAGVSVDVGATVTLSRATTDRYGNAIAALPVLRAGAASSFKVDSVSGVITGLDMGTQWILASQITVTVHSTRRVECTVTVIWLGNGGGQALDCSIPARIAASRISTLMSLNVRNLMQYPVTFALPISLPYVSARNFVSSRPMM